MVGSILSKLNEQVKLFGFKKPMPDYVISVRVETLCGFVNLA
jgi:hypothetical protein